MESHTPKSHAIELKARYDHFNKEIFKSQFTRGWSLSEWNENYISAIQFNTNSIYNGNFFLKFSCDWFIPSWELVAIPFDYKKVIEYTNIVIDKQLHISWDNIPVSKYKLNIICKIVSSIDNGSYIFGSF